MNEAKSRRRLHGAIAKTHAEKPSHFFWCWRHHHRKLLRLLARHPMWWIGVVVTLVGLRNNVLLLLLPPFVFFVAFSDGREQLTHELSLAATLDTLGRMAPVHSPQLSLRILHRIPSLLVWRTLDEVIANANGWPSNMYRFIASNTYESLTETHNELGVGIFKALSEPGPIRYAAPTPYRPEDDEPMLGAVTVSFVNPRYGSAELGWWMARDYRDKGIGKQALHMFVYLLASCGLRYVVVGTDETNLAVHKSMEWLGAEVGFRNFHLLPNGRRRRARWYVLDLTQIKPPSPEYEVTEVIE